ncbi:MAG: transposase [Terriglobia bacterium]
MPKTGRKWWKYSPEFKQRAVQRMQRGEGVAAVARELGIRRKLLYEWREQGYGGGEASQVRKAGAETEDPVSRENSALKTRVADLERLVGKQASELDFFAAALRTVEELRRKPKRSFGEESTASSEPARKAPGKP